MEILVSLGAIPRDDVEGRRANDVKRGPKWDGKREMNSDRSIAEAVRCVLVAIHGPSESLIRFQVCATSRNIPFPTRADLSAESFRKLLDQKVLPATLAGDEKGLETSPRNQPVASRLPFATT